jgi:hypothetical protein
MMDLRLLAVFGFLVTYWVHEIVAVIDDTQKYGRKKRG